MNTFSKFYMHCELSYNYQYTHLYSVIQKISEFNNTLDISNYTRHITDKMFFITKFKFTK